MSVRGWRKIATNTCMKIYPEGGQIPAWTVQSVEFMYKYILEVLTSEFMIIKGENGEYLSRLGSFRRHLMVNTQITNQQKDLSHILMMFLKRYQKCSVA